ncbi:MAG: hypothetical protein LIO95_08540, partial [Clostridiales bacterium]|nr:hypothetical protein [Clostridiales bacterium]
SSSFSSSGESICNMRIPPCAPRTARFSCSMACSSVVPLSSQSLHFLFAEALLKLFYDFRYPHVCAGISGSVVAHQQDVELWFLLQIPNTPIVHETKF